MCRIIYVLFLPSKNASAQVRPGWNFQGTRLLDPRAARDLSAFPNPPWLHGGFQGSRPRLLVLKDVLFSFRPEESCWWNLLELGGGRYSIPRAIPYPLFPWNLTGRGSLISEAQRIHVAKPALTLTHSCWFLGACGTVTGNCESGGWHAYFTWPDRDGWLLISSLLEAAEEKEVYMRIPHPHLSFCFQPCCWGNRSCMNHILTKLDFGDGHGAQDASCEGGGQKYALSQLTELFQRKFNLFIPKVEVF